MPYLVEWAIDIEAEDAGTPREAAQVALALLLSDDPDQLARAFTVRSDDGSTHTIDLSPGAGRVDVDLSTDLDPGAGHGATP